ncbi:endolytic transglycosylase MltG [bacterium]|nr:endolytic transglycosylase MltG [candidate division CSSED10-310 bacterium]
MKKYIIRATWIASSIVLLTLVSGTIGVVLICRDFNTPLDPGGESRKIEITRGMSLRETAELLYRTNLISHPLTLIMAGRWLDRSGRIQTGEYCLSPAMTPREILDKLIEGTVVQYRFTVPEGLTVRQIAARWESSGYGRSEHFIRSVDTTARDDLFKPGSGWEGYLFPETYSLTKTTDSAEIIQRMIDQLVRTIKPDWLKSAGKHNLKYHQIVTLASLIEKETAVLDERGLISSVFHNRLKRSMPLQCDPTVIYALGNRYRGRLLQIDLSFDNPYNTYLYPGLPPGPISNAGAASLYAACFPADVDYLYFVADSRGGHVFSRTLQEHNRAVERYRKNRWRQSDAS